MWQAVQEVSEMSTNSPRAGSSQVRHSADTGDIALLSSQYEWIAISLPTLGSAWCSWIANVGPGMPSSPAVPARSQASIATPSRPRDCASGRAFGAKLTIGQSSAVFVQSRCQSGPSAHRFANGIRCQRSSNGFSLVLRMSAPARDFRS